MLCKKRNIFLSAVGKDRDNKVFHSNCIMPKGKIQNYLPESDQLWSFPRRKFLCLRFHLSFSCWFKVGRAQLEKSDVTFDNNNVRTAGGLFLLSGYCQSKLKRLHPLSPDETDWLCFWLLKCLFWIWYLWLLLI